ncbi:MAG: preprotein translocase subunit SecG [Xanthobacteraceae bacterium]
MLSVVVAIHLMLVLALIGVVLLQKSEGGGLVSSTSGFLTGRGTANVLSRTTALLAAGFFVTSLALSWIASYEHRPVSVINTSGGVAAPAPPAPGGNPAAPPLSTGGGLLNQMEKGFPSLPAGSNPNFKPEAPSGPQVPQSK